MTQRDFDQHSEESEILSADSAILPSRERLNAGKHLVRPDRQFTYGNLRPDQWPPPILNGHSIAVDRLHADFDGPPHRFLICIGDDVEFYLDSTVPIRGWVVSVDHLTQKACIGLRVFGLRWVPKENIHPVPSTAVNPKNCVNPLDPNRQIRQLAKFEDEPLSLLGMRPVLTTFTFDGFTKLRAGIKKGELTYYDYQSEFARLVASREALIKELNERFKAPQLARLVTAFGASHTKHATKDTNAVSIYRAMLRTFVLEDTFSYPTTESIEDAVARAVRATTSKEHFEHYWKKSIETVEPD